MEWKPHAYQLDAAVMATSLEACGLLLQPGMGKTAITLAALSALGSTGQIRRVLLIVPLRPLDLVWPPEIRKWGYSDIEYVPLRGTPDQRREILAAPRSKLTIFAVNPELTEWICDLVDRAKKPLFDMLVIDESTKFKNSNTKRFKSLRSVLKKFARRLILTGTPMPRSLENLWPQVFVLDFGHRLGRYITHYRRAYFDNIAPVYADYPVWEPKIGAQEVVQQKIADICMSLKAADHLQMPKLVINDVKIALPKEARKQYAAMERLYVSIMEDTTINAAQASTARIKCRQMASGVVYDDARRSIPIHGEKLAALGDIIEDLGGDPLLVGVSFLHEVTAINAYLRDRFDMPGCPYLGGGVSRKDADDIVKRWNDGRIPVLLAHPASVAHGLNLQSGGCNIAWFTLTDDRESYEQFNARVYRQGQTRPVVIHRLIADNTVDDDIVVALASQARREDALMEALKRRVGNGNDARTATAPKRRG